MTNKKAKILLVDDDTDIAAMIRAWLPADEFSFIHAGSGQEGLEKFDRERPDLILLDVMMPNMNGYEFCEQLSVRQIKGVPVIFLTGLTDEQSRGRALALGAIDYLVKPVEKVALLNAVRKGIETGQRWAEALNTNKIEKNAQADQAAFSFSRFSEYLRERAYFKKNYPEEVKKTTSSVFCDVEDYLGLSPAQRSQMIAAFTQLEFLPYIDSEQIELGLLAASFCIKNAVVPLRRNNGALYFAMANPFNLEMFDMLKRMLPGRETLKIAIASAQTIRFLFGSQGITREFGPDVEILNAPKPVDDNEKSAERPTVAATHSILAAAVSERASDIHIEPKKNHFDVRFRIDGEMKNIYAIEKELGLQIITRLKALAGMDIAQRRKPQDGAAEFKIREKTFKFRFATTATPFGESIVVRLLDPNMRPKNLEALGMMPQQAALMTSFASRDRGFVLIVGPTGSGKTTTIYSLINLMDCKSKSVMTIEDPVEYWIPYANQQQVNEKAGMTFDSVLKSSVRQDPDILFLGEVRENLSAKTAFDFTSTGHLTIATLHTSNATTAIFRLERLGIARAVMADTILGVVAQRLLKKVCDECAAIEPPTPEEIEMLKQFTSDIPKKVAHPRSCIHCNQTGYFGRVAVYEIIEFDSTIANMVRGERSIAEIREAIKNRGGFLMADHIVNKIRELKVSPDEAFQRVLVEETSANDAIYKEKTTEVAVQAEALPQSDAAPGRILLVDDDPDSQVLIRRSLENRGYEVTDARDAVEALILIGKNSFDLIITDMNMPNLDGFKFMEILKQKGVLCPVAFLTADTSSEMETRCLAAGAVDYFKKPVDKNVLVLKVQGLIHKKNRS